MVFIPSTKINMVDEKSSKIKKAPHRNFQKYTLFPFTQNKRLDFGKTDFNQESGSKKKFQEKLIL